MQLEKQVVSLELAKKLKELGVKQESFFAHVFHSNTFEEWWDIQAYDGAGFSYPAFTVAELGEMLPSEVTEQRPNSDVFGEKAKSKYVGLDFFEDQVNDSYGWERVWRVSVGTVQFREKTEADARAKMLIYLLENKLINQ